jgi:p-hydroxybenzoate 3-monooxygenase
MLGHLLRQAGIDAVIVERQSREHVERRIRAGVLEETTTNILKRLGIDARMNEEGLPHSGFNLADGGRLIHIDVEKLTGKPVMVYGQTEVTRDLIAAAAGRGLDILWQTADVTLHDVDTEAPFVMFEQNGKSERIDARFIAGCDGYHGPSRKAIPESVGRHYERVYPFGWLGILADVPPCDHELIYANHERGFALASRNWRSGQTNACGMNWQSVSVPTLRRTLHVDRRWKNPSRRCAPPCSNRCATAACSSPAMPRTSCRRPARRD